MAEKKTFMDEIAFEPEPDEYVAPTRLGLVVTPPCKTSEEFDRVMPNNRKAIENEVIEFVDEDESHFNREKK